MSYIPPRDGSMSRADKYMAFAYAPFSLIALCWSYHVPQGDGTWISLIPRATLFGAVVLATVIGIAMMRRESILRGDRPIRRRRR